jgi:hypothetical protein
VLLPESDSRSWRRLPLPPLPLRPFHLLLRRQWRDGAAAGGGRRRRRDDTAAGDETTRQRAEVGRQDSTAAGGGWCGPFPSFPPSPYHARLALLMWARRSSHTILILCSPLFCLSAFGSEPWNERDGEGRWWIHTVRRQWCSQAKEGSCGLLESKGGTVASELCRSASNCSSSRPPPSPPPF